jgi:hypothetical protein
MGSSDPLPAGFEIRFGSLNFQATGNDYLMRITNRDELRARRPTGPDPVPVAPAADAPGVRPGGCCGPSDTSTSSTLWPALSAGADGAPTRCACHLAAWRDHWRDDNCSDGGTLGFPSVCAAPRRRTSPPPTPTRRRIGPVLSAMFQRSGTPVPPLPTIRPAAPPASCHPPPRTGTRSGTSPACLTQ